MYTIITLYIIGYLYWIYDCFKPFRSLDWEDLFMSIILAIPFGLGGLAISIILPVQYETTVWSENITTLKDNNSVNGQFFFLGGGVINGSMKYVFYQQNEDSTYQMWQVDYYNAKIRYVNTQPKVIITDKRWAKTFYNKWAIDMDSESRQTYVFEVPQGSVKNTFELDAQ